LPHRHYDKYLFVLHNLFDEAYLSLRKFSGSFLCAICNVVCPSMSNRFTYLISYPLSLWFAVSYVLVSWKEEIFPKQYFSLALNDRFCNFA